MKQFHYSLIILALVGILWVFHKEEPIAEHTVTFLFEKDGCKVYSFKSMEGWTYKKHFFTSCRGGIIDPDDINITEVNNETTR